MTAEEKAKELVNKFNKQMPIKIIPTASKVANQLSHDIDLNGHYSNAKYCALIAVHEIISLVGRYNNYWYEVKEEIYKL